MFGVLFGVHENASSVFLDALDVPADFAEFVEAHEGTRAAVVLAR
jgi:hypothetical protein